MKTVHEVSQLTGVSIRTLQYYDRIGLLQPAVRTEAGYRLYDDAALQRLEQILLFRELEFPLREIKNILDRPDFSREEALEQQIALLMLKKERLERLISLARETRTTGGRRMDFSAFDTRKLEEYAAQVKAAWGKTAEYRAFEEKDRTRNGEERQMLAQDFMKIFKQLGALQGEAPASDQVQSLVEALRTYITEHYYPCSIRILNGLGQMYGSGGEMSENIDRAGGAGTAAFAAKAVRYYCERKGSAE